MRRRVTQSDVAAVAGVSQATVSLILNDNIPSGVRIGAETRQRVRDAIQITGYTANPVAQRLAGGTNQILGVFTYESTFPRGEDDFYRPFLVGIEQAAETLGVDILLFTSARVVDGRRQLARDGWQRLGIADGCLLFGQQEDGEELQNLLDTNYPFVFMGKRESHGGRLPYVGGDYVSATRRQIDRLVALGHRRIGYVGSPADDQPAVDRLNGYRSAMADHGLAAHDIEPVEPGTAAAAIVARDLTAVVIVPERDPDDLADALAAQGIQVPTDLSMLVLGQLHRPRHGGRRWTGFSIPREQMGTQALLLLSRLVARIAPNGDRKPEIPERELRQLLDCPNAEGDTLAPSPPDAASAAPRG